MGAGTVVGRLDNLPQETIDKILEVANNPHPKFVVTLTPTAEDFSGTMDKTVAEINAAYEAGQEIWFKINTGSIEYYGLITQIERNPQNEYPYFSGSIIMGSLNTLILAYNSTAGDGTSTAYSTKAYSLTPASSGD